MDRQDLTVAWHVGPKRHRQNFKTIEEAKAFAKVEAEKLAAGQVHAHTVTVAQAQDMKETLRRLGHVQTPIHVVGGEYADVVKRLGETGTLRRAVEFFLHNFIRLVNAQEFLLMRKATRSHALSPAEQQTNHTISRMRVRVEHIFARMAQMGNGPVSTTI